MYRDATVCFFIALEKNNWICCLDTGRMMGLVVGGVPHGHTTPRQKQNSPLALIHSQSESLSFSCPKRCERLALHPEQISIHQEGADPGMAGEAGAPQGAAQQRVCFCRGPSAVSFLPISVPGLGPEG